MRDEEPAVAPAAAEAADEAVEAGRRLWIALLLGLAALLALCVVLALMAYTRAPPGAPG